MQKTSQPKLMKLSLYIFYGLLVYMPLHIFISTIIGANLGILGVAKAFKDVVLMFGFCTVFLYSVKTKWFWAWLKSNLVFLIFTYAVLTVTLALFRPTDIDAEILGIVYNLRFFVIFLYAMLLTRHFPVSRLQKTALNIVLGVGLVVVSFGIIQYLILPNNALEQLGFTRSNGVLPAFFIDDKPDLERVMSTVRDPNSLGSYLMIIGLLIAAKLLVVKKDFKKWWVLYGLATLACLYLTFSRSAWLGLLLSLGIFGLLLSKSRYKLSQKHFMYCLFVAVGVIVIAALTFFTVRNTYFVQNVIFHADKSTVLEDPNQLRVRFWQESLEQIADQPLGSGPGTAGLASIKNNIQGTTLNENYYLQIATEVGIIGLLLFLFIVLRVAQTLYKNDNIFASALLAALVGLMFANLLVHIWSNEAVAYTWWGLAGLYMCNKKTKSKA